MRNLREASFVFIFFVSIEPPINRLKLSNSQRTFVRVDMTNKRTLRSTVYERFPRLLP